MDIDTTLTLTLGRSVNLYMIFLAKIAITQTTGNGKLLV